MIAKEEAMTYKKMSEPEAQPPEILSSNQTIDQIELWLIICYFNLEIVIK